MESAIFPTAVAYQYAWTNHPYAFVSSPKLYSFYPNLTDLLGLSQLIPSHIWDIFGICWDLLGLCTRTQTLRVCPWEICPSKLKPLVKFVDPVSFPRSGKYAVEIPRLQSVNFKKTYLTKHLGFNPKLLQNVIRSLFRTNFQEYAALHQIDHIQAQRFCRNVWA